MLPKGLEGQILLKYVACKTSIILSGTR